MNQLPITEEQEKILLSIFDRISPGGDFTEVEKIEMAFDTLLNSYDSGVDAEDEQQMNGQPITAEQLRNAMRNVTNPDISKEYKAPEGEAKVPEPAAYTDFNGLLRADPDNAILEAAAEGDMHDRAASELVMNQLPKDQWRDGNTANMVVFAADRMRRGEMPTKKTG